MFHVKSHPRPPPAMGDFDDLFGDSSTSTALTEADVRRIVARAQHRAARGVQTPGFYRERAAERDAIARQIAEALQARDAVSAASLIEEAAGRGFDHNSMLATVERLARKDQMLAMDAAGDPPLPESGYASQPYFDDDDWWLDQPYEED